MRSKKRLFIVVLLVTALAVIIAAGSEGKAGETGQKLIGHEEVLAGDVLPKVIEQVRVCRLSASRMNLTMPEIVGLRWKVFVPQEVNGESGVGVISYYWSPGELSENAPTLYQLQNGFSTLKTKGLLCVFAPPTNLDSVWFVRVELELVGKTYDKLFALRNCLPEREKQDLDLIDI